MTARRRKKGSPVSNTPWMLTYADVMTLLLTFFVLLLSMSSMDHNLIARISASAQSLSPLDRSGPGHLQRRLEVLVPLLRDPEHLLEHRDRIKDLLFPDDILPPELARGDLEENLSLLQHPEGLVLVLTDGLLFAEASAELHETGEKLLDALTPVIHAVNADTNLSGHSDAGGRDGADPYMLSFARAAAVLDHFLQGKVPPDRFSVSGYGPDKAMFDNSAEDGRRKNRRVEILLKTTPRIGSYI